MERPCRDVLGDGSILQVVLAQAPDITEQSTVVPTVPFQNN